MDITKKNVVEQKKHEYIIYIYPHIETYYATKKEELNIQLNQIYVSLFQSRFFFLDIGSNIVDVIRYDNNKETI